MKVGVIMGSQSDWQVVKKAVKVLKDFNVEVEARVISAHRTPRIAEEFAKNAEVNGFDVIIAAAGKAAHLAGVMAGNTHLPIIGVPMKTGDLGGMRCRKCSIAFNTNAGYKISGIKGKNQGVQEKTGERGYRGGSDS